MPNDSLMRDLYNIGAIKFGTFTLKSGITSPIYIDLRLIISVPSLLSCIADAIWNRINSLPKDLLCGVPYTALPMATAISLKHQIPMVMRRKEKKEYGTKQAIEGLYKAGQRCLIIEDLVTSGASVFETIRPLQAEGIEVCDIAVLLDRQQGAKEKLEKEGYRLHSVLTITDLLTSLESQGVVTGEIVQNVQQFIKQNHFSIT
ncbi:uridine 5'-monophosphate synthase [Waddlia chondrophila 2032/99]|uniref:Orotate phosphoribosyltransferase n=1 Tax=Waddlia chondrophila 2032/99 TaxID=765953 RepID=F8LBT1_9BACT|nr:uridine 5'-monophosphate synthase [Waddlia chondrophila 2032/99]